MTYAQGMNDVLSRFFVVMECEVESYWCFTLYLETIYKDFLEDGMLHKLGKCHFEYEFKMIFFLCS